MDIALDTGRLDLSGKGGYQTVLLEFVKNNVHTNLQVRLHTLVMSLFHRVLCYQKQQHLCLKRFKGDALWKQMFRVLGFVGKEEWFKRLDKSWVAVLTIAMGQYGFYEIGDEWVWEPNETNLVKLSRGYNKIRHFLEPTWKASLKGWFCKGEPFAPTPAKSP